MSFQSQYFAPGIQVVGVSVPSLFLYNGSNSGSNDSMATIQGDNYFLSEYSSLNAGDTIYVTSNDQTSNFLRVVTSTNSSVTTSIIT